jgi:hypothetical protein
MAGRLGELMAISGDLWFLPQARIHIVTGVVVLLALVVANLTMRSGSRNALPRAAEEGAVIARLRADSWASDGAFAIFVLAVCFMMAASPVLASAGGFVAYRTTVAPVAMNAIVFVFAVRGLADAIGRRIGQAAMALTACAAFAASLDANYAVMKLARNEYAYFAGIVRQAIDSRSKAIVVIDPRPMGGAEMYNMSAIYDQQGRAVPPRELGCFASYCLQTGTIIDVIAATLGLADNAFAVLVPRGEEPVPGLSCEMLTGPTPGYPPDATKRSVETIDHYRALAPVTCVTLNFAWHDLDR